MSTETPVVPTPEPIVEVEQLRGLSKMIAERAIEKLTQEVNAKADPLAKYFWSRSDADRHLALSTYEDGLEVKPDPQHVGCFVIKLSIIDLVSRVAAQAVRINSPKCALQALKEFLARAEQVADEVDQIRNDIGEP